MATGQDPCAPEEQELLRQGLIHGNPMLRRLRWFMRRMPSDPRCKLCYNPFGGIGGRLLGLAGFAPSRKNPLFCNT